VFTEEQWTQRPRNVFVESIVYGPFRVAWAKK